MTQKEQNQTDDVTLVSAVQRGELQAFQVLVDRHLDHIHAFVSLKLPVAHVADEIAHETFVFAFRQIHEFTTGGAFRAWLRTIAFNKVRAEVERFCREEANKLSFAEHCLMESALKEINSENAGEVEALNGCLEKVPGEVRELLNARYHDEHSTDEIARRFDRSLAWVRTTLCRARQQLRECIERALAREQA